MNEKTENKYGPVTESIIVTGEMCKSLIGALERLERKLAPIRVTLPTNSQLLESNAMPECSEIEERLLGIRGILDGVNFRLESLAQEIRL